MNGYSDHDGDYDDGARLEKADDRVNYRDAASPKQTCGTCRFFGGDCCALIEGTIDPAAVCDLWTKRLRPIAKAKPRLAIGDEDGGTASGIYVEITKADAFEGVIYGVASVANLIDHQGDIIRPDVLRKAAHDFLLNHNAFNDTHDFGDLAGKLVESWVDEECWMIGFKPDDINIAKAAAAGEYVGFSIEGQAKRVEVA